VSLFETLQSTTGISEVDRFHKTSVSKKVVPSLTWRLSSFFIFFLSFFQPVFRLLRTFLVAKSPGEYHELTFAIERELIA